MTMPTTRRRFIKSTAAASSAAIAFPAVVSAQNQNSRVQLASIGADGKGWSDTSAMATHEQAKHVAFCDIDLQRTAKVKELNPEAPIYQDFRDMLHELDDQIDGVTVSTPDHMHAYISLHAMRMGKHVYCQKPLAHNIWEVRQMQLEAEKQGVITRLGNQIHSHSHYRTGVQLIQNGAIGKIKRVHSWCAASGHGKSFHIDRPKKNDPVPDTLDWDKWLGVAPVRPYGKWKCYHPWGWRDWQDFGNGSLGDFGCHIFDPVFTALKLDKPVIDFSADHTGMNDEVWPAQTSVRYKFPGTEYTTGDTIAISWDDGGRLPSVGDSGVPKNTALPRSGSLFVGEEGAMVLPHVGAPSLYPNAKFNDYDYEVDPGQDHYHGWVDGIRTGEQPSDGFDYAAPLTEAVLLGNIAVRHRTERLQWDSENLKVTNNQYANRWIRRDYREGWDISPTEV